MKLVNLLSYPVSATIVTGRQVTAIAAVAGRLVATVPSILGRIVHLRKPTLSTSDPVVVEVKEQAEIVDVCNLWMEP